MVYIPIDNVLNYINRAVVRDLGDDDQLKSWAVQAYKKLYIPGTQTVKDSEVMQVTNHKVQLPSNAKAITKLKLYKQPLSDLAYYLTRADYFSGDNLLQKEQTTNYVTYYNQIGDSLLWTEGVLDPTTILLFTNGNYDEEYTVNGNYITVTNHVDGNNYVVVNTAIVYTNPTNDTRAYQAALVGTNNLLTDIPETYEIKLVSGSTSRNALCNTCPPAAVRNGNTLEFSFESGSIFIEYTIPFESIEGDILIPEHPHVLWEYMAKFAEEMYLNERVMESPSGQDGYYKQRLLVQQAMDAKMSRTALYQATRDQVAHININLDTHYELQFSRARIMKATSYLHRTWSHRYDNNKYYSRGRNH